MLEEIVITNLGAIDSARAEFAAGFTVLTGETGAGKTMMVTGLNLLAGARAEAHRVRVGAERASVEGRFRLPGVAMERYATTILEEAGAETDEDGTVIAVRTVAADGRGRANLGGRSVPVGVLAALTTPILTVHGQNDQLRLARPERQRELLDEFGGSATTSALATYRAARAKWVIADRALREHTTRARELALEADQLRAGLADIDAVEPLAGEDVELLATINRLSDLDAIRESVVVARESAGGEDGAAASLAAAANALESFAGADAELGSIRARLLEAAAVLGDAVVDLSGYADSLPSDGAELDTLLHRQAALKSLTRKYAADIDGVLVWADAARARLIDIDPEGDAVARLTAAEAETRRTTLAAGHKLTAARTRAAKRLATAVSAELATLAMPNAVLEVTLELSGDDAAGSLPAASLPADGLDHIEFRLAPHRDAPALPIAKSASGGELSRIMLALEVVLAQTEHAQEQPMTMIFDEVDAGVGGQAAIEIGKRLAHLARVHQVIVVTHLAQVAAFANTHLTVNKASAGSKSSGGKGAARDTSTIATLDRPARVAELARMLSGLGESETGLAHAEELLALAENHVGENRSR